MRLSTMLCNNCIGYIWDSSLAITSTGLKSVNFDVNLNSFCEFRFDISHYVHPMCIEDSFFGIVQQFFVKQH